ncbi:MAG: hypothetical protein WCA64_03295, partial [Gallionella sp.]
MIWLLILIVVVVLIGGGLLGWPLAAGILGASGITDKRSALERIAQLMHSHDITPAEVAAAFAAPAAARPEPAARGSRD